MKKSSVIFLAIASAAATSAVVYYILHNTKVTEIEKSEDLSDKVAGFIDSTKEKAEDISRDVKEKFEDVVEDVQAVAEHTEEVVNKVVDDLKTSMNYHIPPYEISHETYLAQEPAFKKITLFYDEENDVFATIYNEPVKKFVIGEDNIEHFLENGMKAIYIRNETLGCDYALYKGENNG